ncbi:hypothetical protein FGO68_gene2433 [Halteria grandinella]|uniref:Uncharacterized protein n=1 Tax=Halteria grandinella TaxID=5974 RepID=A0A8J8NFH9_HALGN|nr:hypothetical protein FGO68_gene2433 [Halteria grandinella]
MGKKIYLDDREICNYFFVGIVNYFNRQTYLKNSPLSQGLLCQFSKTIQITRHNLYIGYGQSQSHVRTINI